MKDHYDPWYVRLPDGRTIKAKSTTSVRHHVEAGHVPLNSMVRRDPTAEWVTLVWVAEFADFASPHARTVSAPAAAGPAPANTRSGVAARLDPMRLQTLGIRGLVDELIAALDSTLSRAKLGPAFVAGVLIYVGFFVSRTLLNWALDPDPAPWVPVAAGAGFTVLVLSVLNSVLARLTHQELSTMRPAKLGEGLGTLVGTALPAFLANLVIGGAALGFLFLLAHVPGWAKSALADAGLGQSVRDGLFAPVLVVVKLLSVLAWLLVGMCWLLTPAIVVEESSWLAGVREWRHLLREHFTRIVFYEGLTVLLGLAISLPLTLAVSLALDGTPGLEPAWPVAAGGGENWTSAAVDAVLHGLAAAPLLALLGVANVFIYLNLRYEQGK